MAIVTPSGGSGASMPSNGVIVDPVTGLLKTFANAPITDLAVNTMADLVALTDPAYDGLSAVIKNPGNNLANYFPARGYRMNSRWYTGNEMLYANAPKRRNTWPAAAWVAGALSNASGNTTVSGGATLHSLTAANQTTGLVTYVYISGSTGAGSIDWPIGWMRLMDIPTASNLTLLYPYNVNLRTPVITPIGGGVLSAVEALRISIPPLAEFGGYEALVSVKNYIAANEHRARVWACAAGTSLATLYAQAAPATGLLNNVNDTSATPLGFRCGLQNAGATNVNVTTGAVVSATGLGLGTGAVGYNTPNIQTNVPTEMVITFESATGVDITMELASVIVSWRY